MKRCFAMFVCLILMLLLAVLTDKTYKADVNDGLVKSELATESELSNEIVFDDISKN